ncbi:hypothetical protein C0992_011713, partial [Termitomyces sp. T32_za158]
QIAGNFDLFDVSLIAQEAQQLRKSLLTLQKLKTTLQNQLVSTTKDLVFIQSLCQNTMQSREEAQSQAREYFMELIALKQQMYDPNHDDSKDEYDTQEVVINTLTQ